MDATRLTNLKIDFVSLVDRPAHPDARILLAKRDTPAKITNVSVGFLQQPSNFIADKVFPPVPVAKKSDKYASFSRADFLRDASGGFPIRNMSDLMNAIQAWGRSKNKAQAKAWILRRAKELGASAEVIDRISGLGQASKRRATVAATSTQGGNPVGIDISKLDADVQAHITELEVAKAEAEAAVEASQTKVDELETRVADLEASGNAGEGTDGEIDKSDLPPAVAKRLEEIEKQAEADREAAKMAAARVEKMEEERRLSEHVAKAHAYGNIGQADELGAVLADISKRAPESYERVEHFLKVANERIKVTGEIGGSGPGDSTSVSRVDTLAKSLMEASPTLSKQQAITKVLETNPDLYFEATSALK